MGVAFFHPPDCADDVFSIDVYRICRHELLCRCKLKCGQEKLSLQGTAALDLASDHPDTLGSTRRRRASVKRSPSGFMDEFCSLFPSMRRCSVFGVFDTANDVAWHFANVIS